MRMCVRVSGARRWEGADAGTHLRPRAARNQHP
jgi:hypothetical protein